ncbi:MAG TPA: cell wall-binding repeat-containing protein [Acidothermaceae bacterium]|nr:cell wall-binding repeat-containing protein [Acidothermaceae bacterium]
MTDVTTPRLSARAKSQVGRSARFVAAALIAVPISFLATGVANAAAATHLTVSAPASAVVGDAVTVTVTALDSSNAIATTYAGTVHFTSTDTGAVLPANSTFSGGVGSFTVRFSSTGSKHVTVTDTSTSSITGTSGAVNVTQNTTHLSATAAATATAGSSFVVTVKALDGSGNVVTGYSGTVKLTSSDSQAVLPANSMLSNGQHAFTVTLKTAGNQSVTATDTANSGIAGTTSPVVVAAATTTHFLVTAPASSAVGLSFLFTVTAKDAYQNTATKYGGTVHLTSTDASASLSTNAKLTNGVGNFSATLRTIGSRVVKATDTVTASITGTSGTINVVARTSPTRVAGTDRIGTAVSVSQLNFPSGAAGAVVLARSDNFPDALVAAPLAARVRAPLLFVQGASLPTVTRGEISRVLGAHGTVYLIGSTSAIPTSIETTLQNAGYTTVRIGGSDRFATAAAVANVLGNPSTVLLATGDNFPDALSAGPAAAHLGGVVLLTDGSSMPSITRSYLNAHPGTVYAIGGPAAAADGAATRIVGGDRMSTAAAVASTFFTAPLSVGVASGATFADAMSGGAYLARLGGPILLTYPTSVPASTSNYLSAVRPGLASSTIFGGTAAISLSVQTTIDQLLGF